MQTILKRLEIIKNAIVLEEEEIIDLQIVKLRSFEGDEAIMHILALLEKSNYAEALNNIETYLARYGGLTLHVDKELQALKLELKFLENRVQKLSEQKIEYINAIEEFNQEYNLRLGELIRTILLLKKEILYKETLKKQKEKEDHITQKQILEETRQTVEELNRTIDELEKALESIDEEDENYDEIYQAYRELREEVNALQKELDLQEESFLQKEAELDDDDADQAYEEAKNHYEEFENDYEQLKELEKETFKLNEEEKEELKKLYKKAARLCHPDIVPDELKDQAHALMQALNDAYSKKELVEIKKILHSLENGSGFLTTSDSINDKELLIEKIEEYKQTISELEEEIEAIQKDETYTIIETLEDRDTYFEELKSELEIEKERLENESLMVAQRKEKTEEWIKVLWDWADKNQISKINLPRNKKELLELTKLKLYESQLTFIPKEIGFLQKIEQIYLYNNKLTELPKEICNLGNLTTLILRNNNLKKLPNELMQLDNLEEIKLSKNPHLELSPEQQKWIQRLRNDLFEAQIVIEESPNAKHILSIEVPNFEKIRRYYQNLVDDNKADEMQTYLAQYGKMHKALIYDALEQFIERLDGQSITLIDWGCEQGIASLLVMDYIREKQLDIQIEKVILIGNTALSLSRAILHVKVLQQNNFDIVVVKNIETLNTLKTNMSLNLFTNDTMPLDVLDVSSDIFEEAYFMCISSENDEAIEAFYEDMTLCGEIDEVIVARQSKVGKFQKFEKIFTITNYSVPDIDIDDDEIPF